MREDTKGRLSGTTDSGPSRTRSAAYGDPLLRSPASVHLATAQLLAGQAGADPLVFVTQDQRLRKAAQDLGLRAEAPGG